MGFMDKVKFWKKEDDFGDLGNLGDFGDFNLDEKPAPAGPGSLPSGGDLGPLPSFDQSAMGPTTTGQIQQMPQPAAMEQYPQTQQAPESFGQMQSMQQPQPYPAQQYPAQNQQAQQQYPQTPPPYSQGQYGPAQAQPQTTYESAAQPRLSPTQLGGAQPQARYVPQNEDILHGLELMNAKLDTIKASLDSINARLANLERVATPENRPRYQW